MKAWLKPCIWTPKLYLPNPDPCHEKRADSDPEPTTYDMEWMRDTGNGSKLDQDPGIYLYVYLYIKYLPPFFIENNPNPDCVFKL